MLAQRHSGPGLFAHGPRGRPVPPLLVETGRAALSARGAGFIFIILYFQKRFKSSSNF
jgi:hypothetical protein